MQLPKLILLDLSLTKIAEEAHCSVSQVSQCISGTGLFQNVRKVIADHLKQEVHKIFNNKCHPKPKRKTRWCRVV